jgi:uncharacterized protein YkwD
MRNWVVALVLFQVACLNQPSEFDEGKRHQGSVAQLWIVLNMERRKGGDCGSQSFPSAPSLQPNSSLQKAAAEQVGRGREAGIIFHQWPDGSSPKTRAKTYGYSGDVSEVIMSGFAFPDEVIRRWMNSEPHCRVLRDPKYTHAGLAVATRSSGNVRFFWTGVLGLNVVSLDSLEPPSRDSDQ